jgi:DNA-binding transcriptional LysR family regulator
LNISIGQGVPFQIFSESMAALSEKYPFISGRFYTESQEDVWKHVNEGKSQIGLVIGDSAHVGEHCERMCLGQLRYCFVASRHSPLAQMDEVTDQDLVQYRQILYGSELREYLTSSSYWLVNNLICAVYWACLGIGWTVVPRTLAIRLSRDDSMKDLVILKMKRMGLFASNIYLVWNMEFKQRDVLDFLREDLKKRYMKASASGNNFF